jgi:hypothetical protein
MRSVLAILISLTSVSALAAPCKETDKTAAAVTCVEDHWQQAFLGGDAKYLGELLSDGYHSYTPAGVARDRAAVVTLAQDYAKKHAGEPAPAAGPKPEIQIHGDVAVVFWHAPDGKTLGSVDTFYWADGHWHAWYSQHAGK